MSKRPVHDIEKKWQERWEADGVYRAEDSGKAEKFYGLVEFPYPSGDGLHVGHPRSYTAIDAVTRKLRMLGKNVLFPMGWDAFGLPTENFAIKNKVKPQEATKKNIATFKRQLQSIGFGFDWSREVDTTDPKYYKWTQWQFLKFFNSFYDEVEQRARPIEELPPHLNKDEHRLAFKIASTINWCPRCKIGLANEEAQGGVCERCGNPVEKREKAQWMIRITKYAERLLKDLDTVDYLEKIKAQQINWIGKSEGAYVDFNISGSKNPFDKVTVFTTRPDTLFGATYLVLAPEHPLVATWLKEGDIKNQKEVQAYQSTTAGKSEMERTAEGKEKSGCVLKGIEAVNPANGENISIWISDYVLAGYGTGAIMAVPAHDERDNEFAKKFELPIKSVVAQDFGQPLDNAKQVEGVVVIGYDPKIKKYLGLKNGDQGWLIGGGRDGDESFIDTAKRELLEEAGYESAEQLVQLGAPVYSYYYNDLKKSNRRSLGYNFLAILDSSKQGDTHHETHEAFKNQWVSYDELYSDIKKTGGGVEHWLDALTRAKAAVARLAEGNTYEEKPFTGLGVAINSGFLDGLPTWKAKDDMASWLKEQSKGDKAVTYKLRDWVFSRQRYWGEPIPIVICPKCGYVPVPEKELPLMLPDVDAYEPLDSGESPLAAIRDWVEVDCPNCGGKAERETDTMPNWAGSSWYFLRYCDPQNEKEFASQEKLKYWMPVDLYNGGMEHTTLHLLYSRFWYKFLWDLRIIPDECGSEPYAKRRSHGLILAEGGEKMSKSKGNVVNPDDVVSEYGADVFRVYEMFMGPFDQPVPWDTNGIEGVRKFLDKVWGLFEVESQKSKVKSSEELETLYNQSVKKMTDGIDQMHFNTCVSQMMILTNAFVEAGGVPESMREGYLQILAPFAPHMTEELWSMIGKKNSIHRSEWPSYDESKLKASTFELVVQVNGKVRGKVTVDADVSEEDAKAMALKEENVVKTLGGKEPKQVIYVKGRLVSIVM